MRLTEVLISVVIPACNYAKTLPRAIKPSPATPRQRVCGYLAGRTVSLSIYAQAVRADLRSLTRWSYARKAIRLLFK